MTCSIACVLGALGDRWGMLVVRDLLLGLRRYDDLQRSTGVTNATLSDRLKMLESNGIVERQFYEQHPPRAEYVTRHNLDKLRLRATVLHQDAVKALQTEAVAGLPVCDCRADEVDETDYPVRGVRGQELGLRCADAQNSPESEHGHRSDLARGRQAGIVS